MTSNDKIEFYFAMLVTEKHPYNSFYMYSNDFEAQTIIGGFLEYFNTSSKIIDAYKLLKDSKLDYKSLGCNNHSIRILKEHVEFDYHLDTSNYIFGEKYPYKLPIIDFERFLKKASDFISKYEEKKIPGLIPKKDFDKWSIAPNIEIDPDYIQKQRNKKIDLLKDIGVSKEIEGILKIMDISPQLFDELEDHKEVTQNHPAKIKGLQLALYQIVEYQSYYGNIYGLMYSKIIDYKIENIGLAKSIRSTIGDKVNHRNFKIAELNDLLLTWKNKLDDKQLTQSLIEEVGLEDYSEQLKITFKKYPNLLIELEELLPNHKEELSRKFLKEILLEKINSQEESENLWGYLKGRLIKHLIDEYELPNENWETSEELRQWSFKNEWGLTQFKEYINRKLK